MATARPDGNRWAWFKTRVHGVLSRVFNRSIGPWFYGAWYFEWTFRRQDPWGYAESSYEAARYQRLLGWLVHARPRRVLEVGCAEGHFTRMLAASCDGKVLGVDVSRRALRRARELSGGSPRIAFHNLDIRFEGPAGAFDLVFCCEILYYFQDRSTLRRVRDRLVHSLRECGLLVLMHPHPAAHSLHEQLFGEHGELELVSREVITEVRRPYEIAVYRRIADNA